MGGVIYYAYRILLQSKCTGALEDILDGKFLSTVPYLVQYFLERNVWLSLEELEFSSLQLEVLRLFFFTIMFNITTYLWLGCAWPSIMCPLRHTCNSFLRCWIRYMLLVRAINTVLSDRTHVWNNRHPIFSFLRASFKFGNCLNTIVVYQLLPFSISVFTHLASVTANIKSFKRCLGDDVGQHCWTSSDVKPTARNKTCFPVNVSLMVYGKVYVSLCFLSCSP